MYRQYESNDVLYFYTVPVKLLGWARAAGSYTPCYQHLHRGPSDGDTAAEMMVVFSWSRTPVI